MQTATHAQRQASIISALPSWVPRVNLTVPDNLNQQYRFTFDCPCGKRPRITARIPKAGASHQEMLSLLLKSLDDSQHGSCGQHHAAYPRPESEQDAAKTESLQKENKRLATKKRQLDSEVEVLTAKNKKAAAATTAQADLKRRATLAEQRRLDIDRENKETLIIRNKSTALTTPGSANPGGLIDAIKYWARGSLAAVLQLIMALIMHFGLEQEVRQQLGAEQDHTNQLIVHRAAAALDILKRCDSEQQRREYRIVLTALMPELKKKGDSTGMQAKVAAALRVNRNRATFRESVALRAEIDNLALVYSKELKVGDAVVCKHTPPGGTSTLTSLPAGII